MSSGASADAVSSISTTSSGSAAHSLSLFSFRELTVEDICSLLESLELVEYLSVFREKRITGMKLSVVESIEELKQMKIEMGIVDYRTLFEAVGNYKSNGVPRSKIDTWRGSSKSIGSGSGSGSETAFGTGFGTVSTKDVSIYAEDPAVVFANTFWAENNAGVRKFM